MGSEMCIRDRDNVDQRTTEITRLINYGYRGFKGYSIFKDNQIIDYASVWKGKTDNLPLIVADDLDLLLDIPGRRGIRVEYKYSEPLFAPINKGDFSIDPKELSIFPMSLLNKGLHIIKPDDGFGFRNNFAHNPSIAGHPAFTVKDVKKVMDTLGQSNILFSNAEIYAMPKFHQIYLYDLNANMLEINQEV